jgi:predicted transcriptional regulator
MPKPTLHRIGDRQLRILQALWRHGEATVAQVHGAIPGGARLAYTTVATMLRKMEARGLVRHRPDGRTFVYRAMVSESQVSRGMADHVLDRLFAGSVSALVSHLLSAREVGSEELARIENLIAGRRNQP